MEIIHKYIYLKFIYFETEREKGRERDRERGRERESQAGSALSEQSPMLGSNSQTPKSGVGRSEPSEGLKDIFMPRDAGSFQR